MGTKIDAVWICDNGNVLVFDDKGEQVPEYQGFLFDIADRLKEVCDRDTEFKFCRWQEWQKKCNFAWWFIKKEDITSKEVMK